MKYCLISVAACFMSLPSLAFSGIYPDLPDVGVSAQGRECSDFFPGSCLSIKKQNSLRVAYPQLFKEAENKRFLVSTPDNNLQLIIHQDNTDQYSLHFINSPKSESVSLEKPSSYFQNLEIIARSNVRIKYTPVGNTLTFIHPDALIAITVDGLDSGLDKRAAIATMLSEKAIAVISTVAKAISPDAGSQRVPESDSMFLEAHEGPYAFLPSSDRMLSLKRAAIESANFENKAYEYSLGDAYRLSFSGFGQAVIRPVGDTYNEEEPADGKNHQHRKKGNPKKSSGVSGASTSQQQGQHESGARGAAGVSSGGGGKRPPRKKGEPKKHIPEDYNAPEKTPGEVDEEIQSLAHEIREANMKLATLRGAQVSADTLSGVPEGARGGSGGEAGLLRSRIQELNDKMQSAKNFKSKLEKKAKSTPGDPETSGTRTARSHDKKRPELGRKKFLDDDNNPFE